MAPLMAAFDKSAGNRSNTTKTNTTTSPMKVVEHSKQDQDPVFRHLNCQQTNLDINSIPKFKLSETYFKASYNRIDKLFEYVFTQLQKHREAEMQLKEEMDRFLERICKTGMNPSTVLEDKAQFKVYLFRKASLNEDEKHVQAMLVRTVADLEALDAKNDKYKKDNEQSYAASQSVIFND